MSDGPLLRIEDLSLSYGLLPVLHAVSFEVGRGQVVGLIGESGSGKSTVASAILRLLPPQARITSGRIVFDGTDLASRSERHMRGLRGTRLSLISQDPLRALVPTLSIGRQMHEIQFRQDADAREKRRRSIEMLERVGIPQPSRQIDSYPGELSGGQRQRVLIAMAMMARPDLLIADEPTTALDATIEAQIIELLKDLRAEIGCSMIFVTHDLGLLPGLCDDVVVLERGRISESGPVDRVLNAPQHDYTRILIRCDPARIVQKTRRLPVRGDPGDAPLVPFLGPPDRIDADAPPVLEVQSLNVTYEKRSVLAAVLGTAGEPVRAVKDASFSVRRAETVALVGESGSGKTTIARAILGLVAPRDGAIRIGGRDIVGLSGKQLRPIREKAVLMFQDPISSLSPRFRVRDLVTEPLVIQKKPFGNRRDEAVRLLDMVGLAPEFVDRYPNELSGGQARRVGVARALSASPELIVADEPTAGLDLSVQAEILNLLAEIQEKNGISILMITHNLALVRHISDRLVIMYHGDIVEKGDTDRIFADPQNDYTRRLLAASTHSPAYKAAPGGAAHA